MSSRTLSLSVALIGCALVIAYAISTASPSTVESGAFRAFRSSQSSGASSEPTLLQPREGAQRAADGAASPADPPAEDQEGFVWARRDLDATARANIRARLPMVEGFLPYLELQSTYDEERQYSDGALIAAHNAMMVIYDAEGRSIGSIEGHELATGVNPKRALRELGIKYHHLWSGGKTYIIPYGEFPSFDELVELRTSSETIPLADLPLEGIAQLCRRALKYRLP